ncbi:MAG TPA: MgtC/SapB family protein [Gemmatimonadaceae bacterium]|nr:MgtC/SapB family protein [Gemmatimonadaceae bacterium]
MMVIAATLPAAITSAAEVVAAFRLDLLLKLALAILLGGAIGLEREIAGKPAGLRTNILICVGSVLITDVSLTIGLGANGQHFGDPARLAAQIVSGIGFIGAGTIMQTRGTVTGLTSAATIWVVAAIGIAVGAGRYIEATGAGALVAMVLAGLGTLEHKLRRARRVLSCTIRANPSVTRDDIEALLAPSGIQILGEHIYDHAEDRVFELKLAGPARQFDVVTEKILGREEIYAIHIG